MVSERSADPDEDASLASAVVFAAYDELPERCLELVRGPAERRQRLGEAGLAVMRARPAPAILAGALAAP